MTTLEAALTPLTKIRFDLIPDLFSLTKPRLSSLVIFTCALGLFLAPGEISFFHGVVSVLTTWCLVGGACIINCYMERDIDSRMERTKNRPLPSGKIDPETALYLGVGLICLSLITLYFVINPLTAVLGLLATVIYVSFYTPLKRKTSWALFAGAVPGAIPPLMGWTSVTNSVGTLGLIIFSILFIWQLPHFLSISIYHAEDYNNADIKTFPAHVGFRPTQHRIVIYTFVLSLVSLGPVFSGHAHKDYSWGIYLMGGAFTAFSMMGYFHEISTKEFRTWARRYFFGSLIYLPMVFILMLYFRINIY